MPNVLRHGFKPLIVAAILVGLGFALAVGASTFEVALHRAQTIVNPNRPVVDLERKRSILGPREDELREKGIPGEEIIYGDLGSVVDDLPAIPDPAEDGTNTRTVDRYASDVRIASFNQHFVMLVFDRPSTRPKVDDYSLMASNDLKNWAPIPLTNTSFTLGQSVSSQGMVRVPVEQLTGRFLRVRAVWTETDYGTIGTATSPQG
jgi:hypothetical protein